MKNNETVSTFASFECIERLLKVNTTYIRVVAVYRPPVSSINALTASTFMNEFSTYLENLGLVPEELMIVGDFNLHIEDLTNFYAREFLNLLDTFNVSQRVNEPTHHTLDLLITRQGSNLINDIRVYVPWISDHSIVQFKTTIMKPSVAQKTICYRRLPEYREY